MKRINASIALMLIFFVSVGFSVEEVSIENDKNEVHVKEYVSQNNLFLSDAHEVDTEATILTHAVGHIIDPPDASSLVTRGGIIRIQIDQDIPNTTLKVNDIISGVNSRGLAFKSKDKVGFLVKQDSRVNPSEYSAYDICPYNHCH